jgi:hypothetical protein
MSLTGNIHPRKQAIALYPFVRNNALFSAFLLYHYQLYLSNNKPKVINEPETVYLSVMLDQGFTHQLLAPFHPTKVSSTNYK